MGNWLEIGWWRQIPAPHRCLTFVTEPLKTYPVSQAWLSALCAFMWQRCPSHRSGIMSKKECPAIINLNVFIGKTDSFLITDVCVCVCVSGSAVSNSLWLYGLEPARLLCPWNSPGKNTGVGCHFLLQGIFPTQGSNLGLPHYRQMLYHLSYLGSLLGKL